MPGEGFFDAEGQNKQKALERLAALFGAGTPEYYQYERIVSAKLGKDPAAVVAKILAGPDDAFRTWATAEIPAESKDFSSKERLLSNVEQLRGQVDDAYIDEYKKLVNGVFANLSGPAEEAVAAQLDTAALWQRARATVETKWTEDRNKAFDEAYKFNILDVLNAQVALAQPGPNTKPYYDEIIKRVEAFQGVLREDYHAYYQQQILAGKSRAELDTVGPLGYLMGQWETVGKAISPDSYFGGLVNTANGLRDVTRAAALDAYQQAASRGERVKDLENKVQRQIDAVERQAAATSGLDEQARFDLGHVVDALRRIKTTLVAQYRDVVDTMDVNTFLNTNLPLELGTELAGSALFAGIVPGNAGGSVNGMVNLAGQGSQQRAQAKAEQDAAQREAEITQRAASAGFDPKAVLDYAQNFPNVPPEKLVSDFAVREKAKVTADKAAQQAALHASQAASEALWTKQATDLIDAQLAEWDKQLADPNLPESVKAELRTWRELISKNRNTYAKNFAASQVAGKGAAPDARTFLQNQLNTESANTGVTPITLTATTPTAPTTTPTSAGGAGGPAPSPSAGTTTPPVPATPGLQQAVTAASAPGAAGAITRAQQDAALKAQQQKQAQTDEQRNRALRMALGGNPELEAKARNLMLQDPTLPVETAITRVLDEETTSRVTGITGRQVQYQGEVVRPGDPTNVQLGQHLGIDQTELSKLLHPAPGGGFAPIELPALTQLLTGGKEGVRSSLLPQILKKRGITGPITDTQTVSDIASELALGELQQQDAMRKITPGGFLETEGVNNYVPPEKKKKPPLAPAKRVFR